MFAKILQWIREVWSKMISPNNIKQATRLDVVVSPLMTNALQTWSNMYINKAGWLSSDVKSLQLPASIAMEVSKTVTLEMVMEVSGSPRGDFLNEQMKVVHENIRTYTEYAAAKGGLWFKPYVRDDQIATDFVQADCGYPVAFDANGNMTAVIFADQRTIGRDYYTRLEYHALIGNGYQITNTAYRSTTQNTIGSKVSLGSIADWADLEEEAFIANVDRPLFSYFRMPFANNIDPTSPLGVSIYSRAVGLIEDADKIYSNLIWEFESGKRAIYVDSNAFGRTTDGNSVLPDRRLYRELDSAGNIGDAKKRFDDWSPEFREAQIKSGLNNVKREIEFVCGLAYGTISDPVVAALTATEVKTSKQSYYVTVTDIQKSLQKAIDGLLYAMDVYATIYNLAPAGAYAAAYKFGDSILTDSDTQFMQDMQIVSHNMMPKWMFLVRNVGLSEAEAKLWVADAKAEMPKEDSFFGASE